MGLSHIVTLLACLTPVVQSFGNPPETVPTPIPVPIINTLKPTAQPTQVTLPPTFAVDSNIFAVSFQEFKSGSCADDASTLLTCYTDDKGNIYRFGCKREDGGKIYTDTCKGGCSNAKCKNDWKWLGDEANQCNQAFEEANVFFQYTCHAPGGGSIVGPDEVTVEEVSESRTCSQLSWLTTAGQNDDVCSASAVINGRCSGDVDVFAARKACSRVGGRLCTSDELSMDETKGSGCKYDCERVWSATKCTTNEGTQGYTTLAGASKCSSSIPERCDDFQSQDAVVRCCADAAQGDAPVVAGPQAYPRGFKQAVSMDFPIADGECGTNKPSSQYSCWVNPEDGLSRRFACRPGSTEVWAQMCGTSANCELCQGTWFSQQEEVDKCYSTDANTLYSYRCM